MDGAFLFALRAALAMGLVALPLALAGRPDLAVYAALGSFTATFGRNLPYPRRARILALAAVAMTACVGCGSALAVAARPGESAAGTAAVIAATGLVAGVAKYVCDTARLGGLGAVLLLFSFAVAADDSATSGEVLPRTALAAAAAGLAWLLGVSGHLLHPDRPERLAVATALRATAALLAAPEQGDPPRGTRHRATLAVLDAYRCLGCPPPDGSRRTGPGRDAVFLRLTDLCWTLLAGPVRQGPHDLPALAARLRRQARLLTGRRRALAPALHELPFLPGVSPEVSPRDAPTRPGARQEPSRQPGAAAARRPAGSATAREGPAALRATELLTGHPGGPDRFALRAVPAVRMALGTGAAGGLAALLHLEHGYWAAVSAAAVLHSVNLRTTAQRAVQRTLGTVAGLLLALGVLAADPAPVALAAVIVALEFLLEYAVARNYALGVVFLTPMALLLSELAAPAPAGELVLDRVLGSAVGIAVGLLCALLMVHDHAALRVERALAACVAAAARADRALAGEPGPPPWIAQVQLAVAVVELREADDAAAGELWPAGIDPALLAATEQRAHLLLARLNRPGEDTAPGPAP